jgi:hypothetical protein
MGGHGGLNILPQKKWNVYGRENRLRVARDEAAREEEQARLESRRDVAESEHRLSILKKRARLKYGGAASVNLDCLERSLGKSDAIDKERASILQESPSILSGPTETNALENGVKNPQRAAEERLERRRRGNPATQTSDAKFDQRFRFGAGLEADGENGHLPWYATSRPVLNITRHGENPVIPGMLVDQVHVERHDYDSDRKRKREDKHKQKSPASWDLLRKERLLREEAERKRQAAIVYNKHNSIAGEKMRK